MSRPVDQHLNEAELEALVSEVVFGEQYDESTATDRTSARDHVSSCVACRDLLAREISATKTLSELRMNEIAPMGPECSHEAEWLRVASGSLSTEETEQRLQHAQQCRHCGPLLRSAADIFADERTVEEETVIASLSSARPDSQRELALQLAGSRALAKPAIRSKPSGLSRSMPPRRIGFSIAALAVLTLALWFVVRPQSSETAQRLLADAYTEQRTIELRIPGAAYAPTRLVRGGESTRLTRPTPLLEAEVLIAKQLRTRPDDPVWLHAKGLADLLDGNVDSALSTIDRAHLASPKDSRISLDLATAYVSRADQSGTSSDYGTAIELLSQILARNPKDQLALFNRAIAHERIFAYHDAEQDWLAYLGLDSDSKWANEARSRFAQLQEKIRKQRGQAQEPLLDPIAFVRAFSTDPHFVDSVDTRAEAYLALAIEEWLPKLLNQDAVEHDASSQQALNILAQLLVSRHNDPWLLDFLSTTNRVLRADAGTQLLSRALRLSKTNNVHGAHASARKAEAVFRANHNLAGVEMAAFEEIYANQLEHQTEPCFQAAEKELSSGQATAFPWLYIQVLLESAACDSLSNERARHRVEQALHLAGTHHYPALGLRALGFLAGLYEVMGDPSTAWKYYLNGLALFSAGEYPTIRGYNLYAGLDIVAQENRQWFLDVQLIEEALHMLDSDPDLSMKAVEEQRSGEARLATGDFRGAESAFQKANDLLFGIATDERVENLRVETRIWLADVQFQRSATQDSVRELEGVRERVSHIPDKDLAFDFFRTSGLAHLAAGDAKQARQDLQHALVLAEESLKLNKNERDRLTWSRKTDPAYRGMVEIALADSDVSSAFSRWEWYKSAPLRSLSPTTQDFSDYSHARLPNRTALVSYTVFENRTAVWVYDGQSIQQHWIRVSRSDLDSSVKLFALHCAHEDSDVAELQNESHALYQLLVAPIARFLDPYDTLIIEPDQMLWALPFQALSDAVGRYLGDRFAVSYSPGLSYLTSARPWKGLTRNSRILVVGDPTTPNYPRLPDAEEEAKGIASHFRYTDLLVRNDATLEKVVAALGDVDIFHFSGHATSSPRGVGLVLQNATLLGTDQLGERAFRRAQLVVLSACSTANGGGGLFNDQDSVARSVVTFGVPTLVASRWLVDSRATSTLMEHFYLRLLAGEPPSRALALAERELRSQGAYSHPFYWATFSVFGRG